MFDFFDQKDNFNVYLQRFIKNLGVKHGGAVKIGITASNFSKKPYFEWLDFVKPTINADFEKPLEKNIFTPSHNEFYLADLFADENSNETLQKVNLRLVLKKDYYILKNDESGKQNITFYFKDERKAHKLFWKNYQRPPLKQYWENILKKRHLLAPQDKKQYQGAFFTPKIWTLKAKEYLESVLGKDFEKEYIIWDCAASTGNLLEFFSIEARANIYASTLDEADVKIMLQRVKNEKRFPLYERHIFQFDFLNDDFSKLPQSLQDILNDEKKRQKLVIFINPSYAEAGDSKTERETGKPKKLIAKKSKIYQQYKDILGKASNELFAQFLIRIYKEIEGCILAQFSTLKVVQGQNFAKFRNTFKAEFKKGFCVPASSFDNVKSDFPIGFMIWNTKNKKTKQIIELEICDIKNEISSDKKTKKFYSDEPKRINEWLKNYDDETNEQLAILMADAPDFQQTKHIALINNAGTSHIIYKKMTTKNIIPCCVYFAVRHAIKATWLNDRDQFLYPNNKWQEDSEFHNDCLAFALFHRQNQISSEKGKNNFIPFTDTELDMRKDKFESCFMSDFIAGKCEKVKDKK